MSWSTIMELQFPGFIPPESMAGRTISDLLDRWLAEHMDVNCRADSIDQFRQEPPGGRFQGRRPPSLKFMNRMMLVLNRQYSVLLEKVPHSLWLQEFSAVCTGETDPNLPPKVFSTVIVNKIVDHLGGFYQVNMEVSDDFDYLVRIRISRL